MTYARARRRGPTGWPGCWSARGAGPESLVALAAAALGRSWWWRSSPCSRPVRRTCRWTPATRPSRIAYLLDRRGAGAGAGHRRPPPALVPRPTRWCSPGDAAVDAPLTDADRAPVTDADRRRALRPGHPAYVHLHLRVDRPAQGRGGRAPARSPPTWPGPGTAYPGLAGTALLHSPVSFDLTVTGLLGPLPPAARSGWPAIDAPAARAGGRPTS